MVNKNWKNSISQNKEKIKKKTEIYFLKAHDFIVVSYVNI